MKYEVLMLKKHFFPKYKSGCIKRAILSLAIRLHVTMLLLKLLVLSFTEHAQCLNNKFRFDSARVSVFVLTMLLSKSGSR